jgi:hypothetical protein
LLKKLIATVRSAFGKISFIGYSSFNGVEIGAFGLNTQNHIKFSYKYFNGTKIRGIRASAGKAISVNYTSKVTRGELTLQILDPDKIAIAQLETGITETTEIKNLKDGTYKLVITGTKTEGSYDVSWSVK